jgi:ubiquinone/menaquinone biosynthesis C-methylase UbiE
MEEIKETIKKYWDEKSENYDDTPGRSGLPEVWKNILYNTFGDKPKRILDVGTGTGFLAILLAELGHNVVGVDLSRNMLMKAEYKAKTKNVNINFIECDAENLPFEDNFFDAVITRHLLWTLPHPPKAVNEWKRLVKNSGKVVVIDGKWIENTYKAKIKRFIGNLAIITYKRRNPWKSNSIYNKKEINKKLPYYGGFNPDEVVYLFKNIGLTDISVKDLKWVKDELNMKTHSLCKMAWGTNSYFLVEGYK